MTDVMTLRARKKVRTEQALRAAARRLFAEQGYAATTVEQIAEAAEVSPRTFFRYVAAKEDLLLPDLDLVLARVEDAVRARPVDEPPLESVRQATHTVLRPLLGSGALAAAGAAVEPGNPALAARIVKVFLAVEDRLAEVMTQRRATAAGVSEAEARLAGTVDAFVAIAVVRVAARALRARLADGDPTLSPAAVVETIDAAFAAAPGSLSVPGPGGEGRGRRPGTPPRA